MRFQLFIGIVFLLTLKESECATEAQCTITDSMWFLGELSQNLKTCFPNVDAVDEEDFSILKADSLIEAIDIKYKKNVKSIPKNLTSEFPELIGFLIWHCSLTSVENQFKGLSKLRHLSLWGNQIEHLASDAFVDLISLEFLSLDKNGLQILDKEIFAPLKALKEFKLDGNKIRHLHPEIFSSFNQVKKMQLNDNEIESLEDNIFENMVELEYIYLNKNKLRSISKDLFKKSLKLKNIWLNENEIKLVDFNMFDHLPSLKNVDLRNNTCADKDYNTSTFAIMRNDFLEKCTFTSWIQDLENKVDDLQKSLENRTRENEILGRKIETMTLDITQNLNQKMDNFEQKMTANYESQLKVKSDEIEALKRNGDAMAKQIELLEKKNQETDGKIDAINGKFVEGVCY